MFLCFRVEVFDGEWSHALFTSRIADIVIARNYHDTITIAVYKRLSKLGEKALRLRILPFEFLSRVHRIRLNAMDKITTNYY